jgi:hypothetical protein
MCSYLLLGSWVCLINLSQFVSCVKKIIQVTKTLESIQTSHTWKITVWDLRRTIILKYIERGNKWRKNWLAKMFEYEEHNANWKTMNERIGKNWLYSKVRRIETWWQRGILHFKSIVIDIVSLFSVSAC